MVQLVVGHSYKVSGMQCLVRINLETFEVTQIPL